MTRDKNSPGEFRLRSSLKQILQNATGIRRGRLFYTDILFYAYKLVDKFTKEDVKGPNSIRYRAIF